MIFITRFPLIHFIWHWISNEWVNRGLKTNLIIEIALIFQIILYKSNGLLVFWRWRAFFSNLQNVCSKYVKKIPTSLRNSTTVTFLDLQTMNIWNTRKYKQILKIKINNIIISEVKISEWNTYYCRKFTSQNFTQRFS